MDLVIFEQNKPLVLEALGNGEFDYVESASEVFETEFFRFIKAKTILNKLAQTYPSPRKKEEVPLWFYIASNLSMRLHGVHSFNAFPLVIRSGGLLNLLGSKSAARRVCRCCCWHRRSGPGFRASCPAGPPPACTCGSG